jgi:hypothetical protein
MAFQSKSGTTSKSAFAARLVSKKTGSTVSWINITDQFARAVFAEAKAIDVTAEQAEAVLPELLENEYVEVAITDLTAELDPIKATDF